MGDLSWAGQRPLEPHITIKILTVGNSNFTFLYSSSRLQLHFVAMEYSGGETSTLCWLEVLACV